MLELVDLGRLCTLSGSPNELLIRLYVKSFGGGQWAPINSAQIGRSGPKLWGLNRVSANLANTDRPLRSDQTLVRCW